MKADGGGPAAATTHLSGTPVTHGSRLSEFLKWNHVYFETFTLFEVTKAAAGSTMYAKLLTRLHQASRMHVMSYSLLS